MTISSEVFPSEGIQKSKERQRKNVERGVKLLDKKIPDWREQITRHLSMNICAECVLGQVFNIDPSLDDDGSGTGYQQFQDALLALGIEGYQEEYGFDIENPDVDSYGDLEDIWAEYIKT